MYIPVILSAWFFSLGQSLQGYLLKGTVPSQTTSSYGVPGVSGVVLTYEGIQQLTQYQEEAFGTFTATLELTPEGLVRTWDSVEPGQEVFPNLQIQLEGGGEVSGYLVTDLNFYLE